MKNAGIEIEAPLTIVSYANTVAEVKETLPDERNGVSYCQSYRLVLK
jgi:hypothetical protein